MNPIEIHERLNEVSVKPLNDWINGHSATLVCDPNTYRAAGETLESLTGADCYIFEASPQADHVALKALETIPSAQRLVAVGSGTLNDLCKWVAYRRKQPYACVATALSMNGYLSSTASITNTSGVKQTHTARAPELFLGILDILADAPVRLSRAGLGDSLCRSTAQFDWLLSHLLHGTEYSEEPFNWLIPYESALMKEGTNAPEALLNTLLASGKGMAHIGSSTPASQAEHMIAHAMHALYPEACNGLLHGEEIAITTLIVARMHAKLLQSDTLDQDMKAALTKVHVEPDVLESVLNNAGCPTRPADLGWDEQMVEEAIALSPKMRDRFTVLNLR